MSTVLIVDDSNTIREMMCEQLREQGFEVMEALDGVEGVAKIKEKAPDIVITDVVMPNMNGYEFCRWVKNNPATKNLPVVMCSTKGEAFDTHWAKKQGADAYIVKPYELQELLNVVKTLLAAV